MTDFSKATPRPKSWNDKAWDFMWAGKCEGCDTVSAMALFAQAETDAILAEVARLREQIDGAYRERNQVVAALAWCFPSGVKKTAIEGWDPAWHNCVYIDLPTGQASWHFHDDDASLFAGLPAYVGEWDGHSTPEKYARLAALEPHHD